MLITVPVKNIETKCKKIETKSKKNWDNFFSFKNIKKYKLIKLFLKNWNLFITFKNRKWIFDPISNKMEYEIW